MTHEAKCLRVNPYFWIGSSKKDLKNLPREIQKRFGFALWEVQLGLYPDQAKPLHGLASGVLEIREEYLGNAYRAVYAVRFADAVYVLHVFQKKSKRGGKTPPRDMALIQRRLKMAEVAYAEWKNQKDQT